MTGRARDWLLVVLAAAVVVLLLASPRTTVERHQHVYVEGEPVPTTVVEPLYVGH